MPAVRLTILPDEPIGRIRPELYGHFAEHLGACVDQGIWVGADSKIPNIDGIRSDVITALRKVKPPVMRWPGGCFADDYHWEDGIGRRESRPRTVNLWWGQSIETNEFGTHEFMRFCELIGARPYLSGNVGSGSVREMRDWVEYCNFAGDSSLARRRADNGSAFPFDVRYWGVGNEPWGCGGNFGAEDYARQYRRFATYLRDFGQTELFLIACGPDAGGRPHYHAHWTRQFLESLGGCARIHGFAAHYYCGTAGTATNFSTDQWYELLERAGQMHDVITTHRAIMDEFDPQRKIGLLVDEWGTWHPPAPGRNPAHLWQQNTLRDALVAAITLNIFNNHAEKLAMCNIAQTVNVLQAMCLTEGDKLVLTPTYHIFDLYQRHQNATALRCDVDSPAVSFAVGNERRTIPAISASASLMQNILTVSLTNCHVTLPQEIDLAGVTLRDATITTLTDSDLNSHNTFEEPQRLKPITRQLDQGARFTLPPASISVMTGPLSRKGREKNAGSTTDAIAAAKRRRDTAA